MVNVDYQLGCYWTPLGRIRVKTTQPVSQASSNSKTTWGSKKQHYALMGQTMSCPRRINRLRHRSLEKSVRCGEDREEKKVKKKKKY